MIPIDQSRPREPGLYLFRGAFTGDVRVLNVRVTPEENYGGVVLEESLGVAEERHRHPALYKGTWSKKLKLTEKGLEEA